MREGRLIPNFSKLPKLSVLRQPAHSPQKNAPIFRPRRPPLLTNIAYYQDRMQGSLVYLMYSLEPPA